MGARTVKQRTTKSFRVSWKNYADNVINNKFRIKDFWEFINFFKQKVKNKPKIITSKKVFWLLPPEKFLTNVCFLRNAMIELNKMAKRYVGGGHMYPIGHWYRLSRTCNRCLVFIHVKYSYLIANIFPPLYSILVSLYILIHI